MSSSYLDLSLDEIIKKRKISENEENGIAKRRKIIQKPIEEPDPLRRSSRGFNEVFEKKIVPWVLREQNRPKTQASLQRAISQFCHDNIQEDEELVFYKLLQSGVITINDEKKVKRTFKKIPFRREKFKNGFDLAFERVVEWINRVPEISSTPKGIMNSFKQLCIVKIPWKDNRVIEELQKRKIIQVLENGNISYLK